MSGCIIFIITHVGSNSLLTKMLRDLNIQVKFMRLKHSLTCSHIIMSLYTNLYHRFWMGYNLFCVENCHELANLEMLTLRRPLWWTTGMRMSDMTPTEIRNKHVPCQPWRLWLYSKQSRLLLAICTNVGTMLIFQPLNWHYMTLHGWVRDTNVNGRDQPAERGTWPINYHARCGSLGLYTAQYVRSSVTNYL